MKTWIYIIACKLFLLRIVTRRYNCLHKSAISYLKQYNNISKKEKKLTSALNNLTKVNMP